MFGASILTACMLNCENQFILVEQKEKSLINLGQQPYFLTLQIL